MKKIVAGILSTTAFLLPTLSFAAINTINGQNGTAQTLATTSAATTTMHMKIVSTANTHTFQWDNSPWTVNQGGTGRTSFTAGAPTTTAGTLGDVLQFNGSFPTWVSTSSLGVVTRPGGSDRQIQFNDGGVFAGAPLAYELGPTRFDVEENMNITGNADTIYFYNQFTPSGSYIGLERNSGTMGIASVSSSSAFRIESTDNNWTALLETKLLVTQHRYFAFPDADGTFGLLQANQKWTGNNTFSKGPSATTTVNFGEMGDATSHTCFNTKNTDGADISFYFVGTSMVVESNTCQ
jgi:hypothetical protein